LNHEIHETTRKTRKVVSLFVHFALFRGIRDSSATTIMAMLGSSAPLVTNGGLGDFVFPGQFVRGQG
jgi:ABC-type proline/glycine betaine transport system permease subunit